MPTNNGENGVSYYFQVMGDKAEFFSCKLENSDGYFGGFHCYPMQDGSSTFEFFGGGGERYTRSHGLKKGSNYQLTVTKDYQLTLCEYSDEEGAGKTLFSYDLKEECPEFQTASAAPGDPSALLKFTHETSIKELYLGADGKLTEEKTEAAETTEAADTTTAESETTTSAAVTTTASSAEAAPVTETDAQTQTEAITTTSGGGGFIERAMNADTKTLYGIIGVCAAVLVGGILLYVKFGGGSSRKRRGGDDDPPYTPNPGNKSSIPMPYMLEGKVEQEEWMNYVEQARRALGTGASKKDIEANAMSLANAAIRARETLGPTAKPHSGGRGHMTSLDSGYDTTTGASDPRPEDLYPTDSAPSDGNGDLGDLTVPTSLPEVNGVNPSSGYPESTDPYAQSAANPYAANPYAADQSMQQPAPQQPAYSEPAPLPPAADPEPAPLPPAADPEPAPLPPAADPEPAPSPLVADPNPMMTWEGIENLAASAAQYSESRQYSGDYTLIPADGTGTFIGIPTSGGLLRILPNPHFFRDPDAPFYESGVEVIDSFFHGAVENGMGGAVREIRAALCRPVPGKSNEYQRQDFGKIVQDQDE